MVIAQTVLDPLSDLFQQAFPRSLFDQSDERFDFRCKADEGVRFVGTGEGEDDLNPFDARAFVEALFE